MYSCLNLKKLLPPRNVMWKVFANKLSRSKAKRKPKIQSYETSKKLGWPSSLSIQPKKFKNKHNLIRNHFCFKKRQPPPVFIDQLFIEPISVKGGTNIISKEKSSSFTSRSKKSTEILDQKNCWPESSKEGRRSMIDMSTADDVWESMEMASPQMDGINERAEEFIARFRADMHHQEMLARRNL